VGMRSGKEGEETKLDVTNARLLSLINLVTNQQVRIELKKSDGTFEKWLSDDAGKGLVSDPVTQALLNNATYGLSALHDDIEDIGGGAGIADAVWDEATAAHIAAGSFGALIANMDQDLYDIIARIGNPAETTLNEQHLLILGRLDSPIYGLAILDTSLDTLLTRLSEARAGYLDNVNNAQLLNVPNISTLTTARIGYLDNLSAGAVALNSDIATLLTRLSAARAGYLDNLSAGAVALASTALSNVTWTDARAGYLDYLASATYGLSALNDDLDTLLTRLSALRAGYLDNLSAGAVALALTALSTANWTNTRAGYLDNINQAGLLQLTTARAGYLDNINNVQLLNVPDISTLTVARIGYLDNLSAGAVALNSDIATLLTRLSALRAGYLDNLSAGAVALASTALSTAVWTNARAGYLDNINQAGLLQLTADRAGYLDNLSAGAVALASVCTSTRLTELDAVNIPADVDTLLTRLSALRAGYLDNLSAGAVALQSSVDDLEGRLTAARAGYLDELDFDLSARLGSPAGASISADILAIDNFVDDLETRLTAARAGYLDNINQAGLLQLTAARVGYLDNLSAGAVALNSDIATLLTRLSAARAGYLDNLSAGAVALASTALSTATWTAARAGYLDELAAANIPADIDTLLTRLSAARAGYLDNLSAGAVALAATALSTANWTNARAGYLDELAAANIPADVDAIKTKTDFLPSLARSRVQSGTQATTNALVVIGVAITAAALPFIVEGYISLNLMVAGDIFLVIEEIRDQDDATYREFWRAIFYDAQTSPMIRFKPKMCQGWRVSIQRTGGADRNVTYQFFTR